MKALWREEKKEIQESEEESQNQEGQKQKGSSTDHTFYFHSIFATVIVIFFAFRPAFDRQQKGEMLCLVETEDKKVK